MLRRLAIVLTLLFIGIAAPARAELQLEIVEYGLYSVEIANRSPTADGVGRSAVRNVCHLATTTTVPAKLDVDFGLRFRVRGVPPGEVVSLIKVVVFPREVTPPGGPAPIRSYARTFNQRAGELAYIGYGFDAAWELMPGVWTFQLFAEKRLLLEQRFTVVEGTEMPASTAARSRDCFQVSSL